MISKTLSLFILLVALLGSCEAFSAIPSLAPALRGNSETIVAGRGDRRTNKGKRTVKSFGRCRPRKGKNQDDSNRLPGGGLLGQPTHK
eukprot:CAMPEP_0184289088 /NCGR_PEP_ID=MMETSP1049-20130417/1553_1 /TAXON_ID=77928 /ORGANISM="Proteomonas sulcata, Strain CCMP704" /LENGTH=87 /DNA_ID=CAMNT_0026595743 /DNA_START=21 /DNA_END=284 /DNA_ORIENTATION=+